MQGNFRDIGFSEVLQLLGSQGQSGSLTIKRGKPKGALELFLLDGRLVGVQAIPRRSGWRLGERLVATEQLASPELRNALKQQRSSDLRLGEILVREGYVGAEVVQAAVAVQARDEILSLFEASEGQYAFRSRPVDASEQTLSPMSVEQILMDGVRTLDEWPLIRSRVNNHSVVYRHLRSLSSRGVGGAGIVGLDDLAAKMHGHVDGVRNVEELVAVSGFGLFDACRALSILLSQGYIGAVKVKAAQERPGRQDEGRASLVVRLLATNATALCLVGGLTVGPIHDTQATRAAAVATRTHIKALQRSDLTSLTRVAVEAHRLEVGTYPLTLADAQTKGFLSSRDLHALKEVGMVYISIGTEYELR